MRKFLVFTVLLTSPFADAASISSALKRAYLRAGGPIGALAHMQCVLDTWGGRDLKLKGKGGPERCREQNEQVNIDRSKYALIADFTVQSNRRRFFLLDLQADTVQTFFVSHGRNGDTSRTNTIPREGANTVLRARYFNNGFGSNATSTGLFVTGRPYLGQFQGENPRDPKYALVVHGLEAGVNDNACSRVVVIHGIDSVHEHGLNRGVHTMSSGCFMLDYEAVNSVIAKAQGERGMGTALLSYGPREAALSVSHYCKPHALD